MAINAAAIEKDGVHSTQAPISGLLADLDLIDGLIAKARKKRRRWRWLALIVLVVGVLLTAVTPVMLAVGVVGGLVLLIGSFFVGDKFIKNEGRGTFARGILTVLREDSSAKSVFTLKLNVLGKEVKKSEGHWPNKKKGKQTFLEDEWLTIEGPLLDDTALELNITDLVRVRQFVSASNKTKSKRRVRKLVELKLNYPAAFYGDARTVQQGLKNIFRLPPGTVLKSFRGTEKALAVKAIADSTGDLKEGVVSLILGVYRVLNLSRKVAKSAAGGAQ